MRIRKDRGIPYVSRRSKKARNNVAFVTIDLPEYYQAVSGDPCDLSPLWLHNLGKNQSTTTDNEYVDTLPGCIDCVRPAGGSRRLRGRC